MIPAIYAGPESPILRPRSSATFASLFASSTFSVCFAVIALFLLMAHLSVDGVAAKSERWHVPSAQSSGVRRRIVGVSPGRVLNHFLGGGAGEDIGLTAGATCFGGG
jgi:hypothetical protein